MKGVFGGEIVQAGGSRLSPEATMLKVWERGVGEGDGKIRKPKKKKRKLSSQWSPPHKTGR